MVLGIVRLGLIRLGAGNLAVLVSMAMAREPREERIGSDPARRGGGAASPSGCGKVANSNRPGATPPEPGKRRSHGTLALDRLLALAVGPAARKRGFVQAALLAEWGTVVGPTLAGRCHPIRVDMPRGRWRKGVLYLSARGGAALELQHAAPQIIERVNAYFGFAAIRQLKLVQLPVTPTRRVPAPPPPRHLEPEEEEAILASVRPLSHPSLQAALAALGRAVRRGRG
jgi:hypothetical protein